MAVKISTQARNDAGNSIISLIDIGTLNPNGVLEIRSGPTPATPETAATGTLLATLELSNPAFSSFNNGRTSANTIVDDMDLQATGIAGWFRIYDRDNNGIIDGEISETGGGGDIEFDNIDFIKGGTVSITNLQAIIPQ